MKVLRAEHLTSGRAPEHWMKPSLPEYAFIGRRNVGKSSLINMLCGIRKLARLDFLISKVPPQPEDASSDVPWFAISIPDKLKQRILLQPVV